MTPTTAERTAVRLLRKLFVLPAIVMGGIALVSWVLFDAFDRMAGRGE